MVAEKPVANFKGKIHSKNIDANMKKRETKIN